VCTVNGIRHLVIPRSRKDAYRVARGLRWGSAISFDDAKLLGLSNAPETQKM
jgi:hypothetical protein